MSHGIDLEKTRAFGAQVNFGRTASDYIKYRRGFPDEWFNLILQKGIIKTNDHVLDLGTGTGSIARGLAMQGCKVTGLDLSTELIEQAKKLDTHANVQIQYLIGTAEQIELPPQSFDVITAGQCWHWFKGGKVAQECMRLLKSGGAIVIAHFDWLPLTGSIVEATEKLILKFNPRWSLSGGTGIYPRWLTNMAVAGFKSLETFSFDLDVPYTPEAWRGRIRASAGVQASLSDEKVAEFDGTLKEIIEINFPGATLSIPHRCWTAVGVKPA